MIKKWFIVGLLASLTFACGDDNETTSPSTSNTSTSNTSTSNTSTSNTSTPCEEDALSPNHTPEMAAEISTGDSYDDLKICSEVFDFFSISLEEGELISVSIAFSHVAGDLDMYAFAPGDLEEPIESSISETDAEIITLAATAAGDYIIAIEGYDGAEGEYSISIDAGCVLDSDCEDGKLCNWRQSTCVDYEEPACGGDGDLDPNGTDSQAVVVPAPGETYEGLGTCPEDVDLFRVDLNRGDSLTVTASNYGEALVGFGILDDKGTLISSATEDLAEQSLTLAHLSEGSYYVLALVLSDSSMVTYDLDVAMTAGACGSDDDCQPGRAFCQAEGFCDSLEGAGAVELGQPCDDASDCTEDAEGCFNASVSGAGYLCTIECDIDDDCASVGTDAYCSSSKECRLPCTGDNMCTAIEFCGETNRCESLECTFDADCARDGELCLYNVEEDSGLCGTFEATTCGLGGDGEPNDTDSQATPLTLTDGELTLEGQELCFGDFDMYSLTLSEPGNLSVSVSYTGPADVDIVIYKSGEDNPVGIGYSSEEASEATTANFLSAGDFIIQISYFDGMMPETYTMDLSLTNATCEDDDACISGTDVLRLTCDDSGACVDFDGAGMVELGGLCDTTDDCTTDADLCFNSSEAAQVGANICTLNCGSDEDCATLSGTTCQANGLFGFCLPPQ